MEKSQEIAVRICKDVISVSPLHGGSTNASFKLKLRDGTNLFCKERPPAPDAYEKEVRGLQLLRKSSTLRTPRVVHCEADLLVLEWIPPIKPDERGMEALGGALAAMHKATHSPHAGLEFDNYIGATLQKNPLMDSWADFYWLQRLEFQKELLIKKGINVSGLQKYWTALRDVVYTLLNNRPLSLLHGDLWFGNVMFTRNQEPVWIDPAVYYGDRETDLALARLFGGFSPAFYKAYQNSYQLDSGWQAREPVYQLYHLLNHINMLGEGYLEPTLHCLKRCVLA